MTCKAYYESFDPVEITIQCNCNGNAHKGKLSIGIRDVKLNLMDLSMEGAIPGNPRISSKTDMQIATMEFNPETELGEIKKVLQETSKQFSKIAKIVREELLNKPILK